MNITSETFTLDQLIPLLPGYVCVSDIAAGIGERTSLRKEDLGVIVQAILSAAAKRPQLTSCITPNTVNNYPGTLGKTEI